MARKESIKILRHISMLYVLLMLIPVIMGSAIIWVSSHLLWNNLLDSTTESLSAGTQLMDDTLLAIDEMNQSMVGNTRIQQFLRDIKRQDAYACYQLSNSLFPLHTPNSVVMRYALACIDPQSDKDIVISPNLAHISIKSFYQSNFQYSDYSMEEFLAFLRSQTHLQAYPAQRAVHLNHEYNCILVVFPYFLDSHSRISADLLYYLDTDHITELFHPLLSAGAVYLEMFDSNNVSLYSRGNDYSLSQDIVASLSQQQSRRNIRLNGSEYALLSCKAPKCGWTFVALVPHSLILTQNAHLLWIVVLSVLAFILLALFLVRMITNYSQKPLAQILETLPVSAQSNTSKGLWPLQQAVERMALNNEDMVRRQSDQQIQLRDAAIAQLVKGNFDNEDEMRLQLSSVGIQLPGPDYQGIYMQIANLPEVGEDSVPHSGLLRVALSERINAYSPALQLLTLKNSNEYILLHASAGQSNLEEVLSDVYSYLKKQYGLDTAYFVGVPCKSLRTLNQSFSSAHLLLDKGMDGEHYLLIAERIPLNDSAFDYSISDEVALLAHAQRNETEKVEELLDEIFCKNFIQRTLSPFTQQWLFGAMLHSLSKSDCPLTLPGDLTNVPLRLAPEMFFAALAGQYRQIGKWVQENKRRNSRLMMEKVISFVNEHFCYPDMSLNYVAMQFGLTEEYLSKNFKQWTEMNFLAYLENMRLRRAQMLLRTTGQSIQSIAESVGYANARTFRRAYGRVIGYPPSDDRGNSDKQ